MSEDTTVAISTGVVPPSGPQVRNEIANIPEFLAIINENIVTVGKNARADYERVAESYDALLVEHKALSAKLDKLLKQTKPKVGRPPKAKEAADG